MRVLHLFADPALTHGASVFEHRMARQLMEEDIFFDYLVTKPCSKRDADLRAQTGSKVFQLDAKDGGGLIMRELRYFRAYEKFFREHDYDIVYADTENALRALHLLAAKRAGVKTRVVHSHNTSLQTTSRVSRALAKLIKNLFLFSATDYFACSDAAAAWLFPKRIVRGKRYGLLNNGVDLAKFAFHPESRKRIRAELGVPEDAPLIGHVGRFMPQKNHAFLLEIFAEITKRRGDARLMLIGGGELEDAMKARAKALGIAEKVIFYGNTADVAACLSAMDLFLMPSLFEGLPVTGIEAQAAGLNCLFSDSITRELKLTPLWHSRSLSDSAALWAEEALRLCADRTRPDTRARLEAAGYSAAQTAERLAAFYREKSK